MSTKASALRIALLLITVLCPGFALAQESRPIHPWYSNARVNVGSLAVPGTGAPPPADKVRPTIPSATIMQASSAAVTTGSFTITHTTGSGSSMGPLPTARSIMMAAGVMAKTTFTPNTSGLFPVNTALFQVRTTLTAVVPSTTATFGVSGRSGPSTVSFCAATGAGAYSTMNPLFAPGPYNPNCTTPNQVGRAIPGRVVYTRTRNQFGGASQGTVGGTTISGKAPVELAAIAAGTPPCNFMTMTPCQALFINVKPASMDSRIALGGAFGFSSTTMGTPVPAPGLFNVGATASGLITTITPTGMGPGGANPAQSFGGPWTTGQVVVIQTQALGANETFFLSGYDKRVSGTGTILMVSGGISRRTISGPNANRGWLRLQVPEPGATFGAAGALLALGLCHGLVRRRSR